MFSHRQQDHRSGTRYDMGRDMVLAGTVAFRNSYGRRLYLRFIINFLAGQFLAMNVAMDLLPQSFWTMDAGIGVIGNSTLSNAKLIGVIWRVFEVRSRPDYPALRRSDGGKNPGQHHSVRHVAGIWSIGSLWPALHYRRLRILLSSVLSGSWEAGLRLYLLRLFPLFIHSRNIARRPFHHINASCEGIISVRNCQSSGQNKPWSW